MEYPINMITLGVNDPEKMSHWLNKNFGWPIAHNTNGNIFFNHNKMLLVLVHNNKLAKDLFAWEENSGFKKFAITIAFASEYEVNCAFNNLQQNGVTIIQEPLKVSSGVYNAYITDPEDNFWELAFYPAGYFPGKVEVPECIWHQKKFSNT